MRSVRDTVEKLAQILRRRTAGVWLAVLGLTCPLAGQEGARQVRPKTGASGVAVSVFLDVNVIPMDSERALQRQTVIVRGDRIAAIDQAGSIPIPRGARRIDGRGKYLIPGLVDTHIHLRGGTSSRHAENREDDRVLLLLHLLNGITTVINMAGHQEILGL